MANSVVLTYSSSISKVDNWRGGWDAFAVVLFMERGVPEWVRIEGFRSRLFIAANMRDGGMVVIVSADVVVRES